MVLVTCSRAFSSLAINDVPEPLLGAKPAETSLLPESHPASVMVGSPAVPREGVAAYVSTMVDLHAGERPRGPLSSSSERVIHIARESRRRIVLVVGGIVVVVLVAVFLLAVFLM